MCVGVRTTDNCYGLTPSISNKCFSVKIDQVDLWHQRLGHASHKQIEKFPNVMQLLVYLSLRR